MMERIAETSPRLKARIAGALFLLAMLTGIFAGFRERQHCSRRRRRGYGDQHTDAQELVSVGFRSLPHRNDVPDRYDSSLL
jgi:hypothetical protein